MAPQENFRSYRRSVTIGRLILLNCILADLPSVASPIAGSAAPVVDSVKHLSLVEAADRIEALRTEIAYHDELYFKRSAPVISDSAYDLLKRELTALEQAFPESTREGEESPPAVGDDRSDGFVTYRHRVRMLSLNKSYTEAELRAFDARLTRQLGRSDIDYVVEPKFDGLAISVTFEKGKLIRAVTRGNGTDGDDVTANVLTIRALPRDLIPSGGDGVTNSIPDLVELRGEVYLTFAEFARINRERERTGEAPFLNPRNLAAGTLKQSDSGIAARRHLRIVFYGLGACEPQQTRPRSQLALLRQLHRWGLPTIDSPRAARGADAMWQAVQAVGRERPTLTFPIDGAVVKINEVTLQDQTGVTLQAPLWAMAYKFVPERAETQLRAITLQIGRTGVLTPVAELVPVRLDGSTVARASLYNRDEIARRDIRVGDFVYIEKAGEIIPAISGVNRTRRTPEIKPYVFPVNCPDCQTLLMTVAGEAAVRCPNPDCPTQIKRRIEHFVSPACVDVPDLGPAMVAKLVQKGWIKNVADIYQLRRGDLLSLGKNVERSTDHLLANIERSKRAELWRFINGLGIPQVGGVTSRILARHFGGLPALAQVHHEDFFHNNRSAIPGIGDSASNALASYFSKAENIKLIEELVAGGVAPRLEAAGASSP